MGEARYARHRPLLDDATWRRLTTTRFVIAGCGGLGCHVLSSLARLGPLTLELWDPAKLDELDLNRQILYTPDDLGHPKVYAAAARLRTINPDLEIAAHQRAIDADAFRATRRGSPVDRGSGDGEAGEPATVILDCLDSFAARAGLEAIRNEHRVTVFHGGVEGWYGQVTTIGAHGLGYEGVFGPDFGAIPAATKPILPQPVAAVAALQVGEVVHWCETGDRTPLSNAMLLYDGRTMRVDRVEFS